MKNYLFILLFLIPVLTHGQEEKKAPFSNFSHELNLLLGVTNSVGATALNHEYEAFITELRYLFLWDSKNYLSLGFGNINLRETSGIRFDYDGAGDGYFNGLQARIGYGRVLYQNQGLRLSAEAFIQESYFMMITGRITQNPGQPNENIAFERREVSGFSAFGLGLVGQYQLTDEIDLMVAGDFVPLQLWNQSFARLNFGLSYRFVKPK